MNTSRGFVRALVAALLGSLPAGAWAAPAKVAVVALALWSDQGVFLSEARRAAALLATRYHAAPVLVRANSRAALAAGPSGMAKALAAATKTLDPDRDVLVLMITSHGSPEGIAEKGGRTEGLLAPAALATILSHVTVRRTVLIVSACYSGIFLPLAGPDRLVITAADATHPSFGCEAGARWTYFGRAFFDEALRAAIRTGAPLPAVFQDAAARVRARELKEGFEPSNPQIAGGADVLPALVAAPGTARATGAR